MILSRFLGDGNSIACNIGSHFVLRLLTRVSKLYPKTKNKNTTQQKKLVSFLGRNFAILLNIILEEKGQIFFLFKKTFQKELPFQIS